MSADDQKNVQHGGDVMKGRCCLCEAPTTGDEGLQICSACEALPESTPESEKAEAMRLASEAEKRRRARWVALIDDNYLDPDPAKLPELAAKFFPRVGLWDYKTGTGITLVGHTGAGKTRLAIRALEAAHMAGASCRVMKCARMRMRLWESFKAASEVLAEALKPDVLLLDDLGQGATSEQIDEVTLAIIEDRGAANKPTLVTTQFTERRLVARFARAETGEAIARRVGREFATQINLQPKTTP